MGKGRDFRLVDGDPGLFERAKTRRNLKKLQIFATKSLKKIVQPKAVGYNKKRIDLV